MRRGSLNTLSAATVLSYPSHEQERTWFWDNARDAKTNGIASILSLDLAFRVHSNDNITIMVTHDDLIRFQEFAAKRISTGKVNSLEELVSLWKDVDRAADAQGDDLAAVRRGIADADAGRTKPVEQAFDEVRKAIQGQR